MRRSKQIKIVGILISFLAFPFIGSPNEPYLPLNDKHSASNYFSVYIMDKGQSTARDFRMMLLYYNPDLDPTKAETLANAYILEANKEGVNQDIAFIQMCLETGFLTYTGSVEPHQNNFGGLGAVNKTAKGEYFPDIQTGVRAHIQHLKAYASTNALYNDLVDLRFRFVKRGIAPTIYDLPGKWAADKEYANKLENLLTRLFQIRKRKELQKPFGFI